MEAKPTKLAIDGKIISVEKIAEKSLAQWKAQLKNAGLTIDDARAEKLWLNLRGELTEEQQAAKAAAEAKAAEIKAAAEAKAKAAAEAARAKFNQLKKGK